MRTLLCLCAACGIILSACSFDGGKKKARKEAEEAAKVAAENPAEAVRKAFEGLNSGKSEAGEVKPVDHRALRDLLKESLRGGFERTEYESQTVGAMGFNMSNAQAQYTSGDCRLDVNIADTGGMGMAVMSMAAWSQMEVDREDKNGYERTSTFHGHKSFEKYDKSNNSAEIALIVDNRFIVTVNGNGCEMDDVKKAAGDLDLDELRKLM